MCSELKGIPIAVIGGDDRELYLVPELLKLGAIVRVIGLPQFGQHSMIQNCESLHEAVRDVRFIILPMPGIDENGRVRALYSPVPLVLDENVMSGISPETVIFVGVAKTRLKELAQNRNLKLIELADMDEVAILNSIPSAEGAIQMAMEELPITIHGSRSVVLGFGRTGMTLARVLAAMGAKVSVVARKASDRARAYEMGFEPLTYLQLGECLAVADVVYNTVPAMVLGRDVLECAKPGLLIIDLASAPGGTDFNAAEELGIKAILAPGLPGKVAPKTAGLILAKVIPNLIRQELLTATKACNGSGN
ncbi:dipicolinate synthase subunit DpsA [Thermincola potens]|uniref:Dipicolinic acid synthetase, A subunit n=1 Tax=Thermincola potens (strain JR) TaxID=635013 RepID=D5XF33_THEPJ|nr:dipicolinate synthase subunit DpsA [Thermincola potens]ADG82254.1 dipicolinic acid synthetase, A subunit [Thermincola potens JR]